MWGIETIIALNEQAVDLHKRDIPMKEAFPLVGIDISEKDRQRLARQIRPTTGGVVAS